jgi:MazG family protein
VFGDVEAMTPAEVKANWDVIKASERTEDGVSALDGVPGGMPALLRAAKVQNRAAKVGFDWASPEEVMPKLREEIDEIEAVLHDSERVQAEVGDLLFSVINLARHLGVDPELGLRASITEFERRFRLMEVEGPLDGLSLDELNARWERAKGFR